MVVTVARIIWGCRRKRYDRAHAHQTWPIFFIRWPFGLKKWIDFDVRVMIMVSVIRHEFLVGCGRFHGHATTHAGSSSHNWWSRAFSKEHIFFFLPFFLLLSCCFCVRKRLPWRDMNTTASKKQWERERERVENGVEFRLDTTRTSECVCEWEAKMEDKLEASILMLSLDQSVLIKF